MELRRALDQISEIHTQLAKTETFRGYRALPTALGGALGLVAAGAQDSLIDMNPMPMRVAASASGPSSAFADYWMLVAGLAAVVGLVPLAIKVLTSSAREQRRSLEAIAQIVPALVLGGIVGLYLYDIPGALPGLWCGSWALGLWASRPYLPRAVGWICAYYLAVAIYCLATLNPHDVPNGWIMGGAFGLGQLALAFVLWMQLERSSAGVFGRRSQREGNHE